MLGVRPLDGDAASPRVGDDRTPATLLYSSRSVDDVIYRPELDAIAGRDRNLRVLHTLTRSQPAGWTAHRGRIDRSLLAETCFAPAAPLKRPSHFPSITRGCSDLRRGVPSCSTRHESLSRNMRVHALPSPSRWVKGRGTCQLKRSALPSTSPRAKASAAGWKGSRVTPKTSPSPDWALGVARPPQP